MNLEKKVLRAEVNIGIVDSPRSICRYDNPLTRPVFDKIRRLMQEEGWVDDATYESTTFLTPLSFILGVTRNQDGTSTFFIEATPEDDDSLPYSLN